MTLKPADLLRIQQLPLLRSASAETFTRLTRSAFLQRFPRDAQLTAEGEVNDFLYVLMEGAVELEGTWNDRDSTLALLRPLSTFVLASVILDVPALMTARTIARSQVLMIPGETFRQAVREDAALSFAVAEELSGCYSGVVRVLKNYKLRGALERLANYLLVQQRRQGGGPTLRLPCQKRVLASLLGMTPENLSRAFATLGSHGVQVDGANVTINRPAALARLAKPDALIDDHAEGDEQVTGRADRERRSYGQAELDRF
ncbi:transcriptional activator FtrB [Caulobacter sp. RL271]|uniref:Helix-turn-helix domain-containing protein n=1 Tax=Caulobacter segnis TaxID=88688 RepID=A0ABY4ZP57_9CAUL|nr:helix-turn-helix domain-containing protein [Caulobacter segnis]USQ94455.1 helix-turn-helix domain-containing protein [Caulobacter segnis]